MPCYEVRVTNVEFKAENRALLDEAIKSLDMRVQVDGNKVSLNYGTIVLDLAKGMAQVQDGYQSKLNELKRAYTAQAVAKYAKMQGWMNQPKTQTAVTVTGQLVKF